MTRGGLPALRELELADDAALWRRLGFAIGDDGSIVVAGVTLRFSADRPPSGISGWAFQAAGPLPTELDGVPTRRAAATAPAPAPEHPNGAFGIDHVVVRTPDIERTLSTLRGAGFEVRRRRDAGSAQAPMRQAFLWAGDVLLEVVGPPLPTSAEPARLWGLVVVVGSLEQLVRCAGGAVGDARPAVQPGRFISSLRREAGSSVPLAFMTPHARAGEDVS